MTKHKIVLMVMLTALLVVGAKADVAALQTQLPMSQAGGANAVAMSGEWAALGAYDENYAGNPNKTCYVDVYKITDYTTTPLTLTHHQLIGGAKGNCNGNKGFGSAISINGDRMLISTTEDPGEVRLYTYDSINDEWIPHPTVPTIINPSGVVGDNFGYSLSIKGDDIIVGAPNNSDGGVDAGKVYIFSWITGAQLTGSPLTGNPGALFGSGVTGYAESILIGQPGAQSGQGGAVLYDYNGTSFTLAGLFTDSAAMALGTQVAMDGEHILVSGDSVYSWINESGGSWFLSSKGLNVSATQYADVSISDGIYSVGVMGSSVLNYPDLSGSTSVSPYISPYNVKDIPTITTTETAEDISLDRDQLLIKQGTTQAAVIVDHPCGFGSKLTANQWAIVSAPCGDGTATIDAIFSDDLGTYGDNWVMYEQNGTDYSGTTKSTELMSATDTMAMGKGYWIIADSNATWKADDTVATTRTALVLPVSISGGRTYVGGYFVRDLPSTDVNTTKKIMIGNPFSRTFQWKELLLGISSYLPLTSLSTVYNPIGYVYDPAQTGQPYKAISATTPGIDDTIEPNQGFWLKQESQTSDVTGLKLALPFEK